MKIAIGCDPNAAFMKNEIIECLAALGHHVVDFGSDNPIYAEVAFTVAKQVVKGPFDRGVLLCGTGIGVSIAANKVLGAHCALITDLYQAERAALSNNSNLIAMGSLVTSTFLAKKMVETWVGFADKFDPSSPSGPKNARITEYEETLDHRDQIRRKSQKG